ncbi:hypothetical protein [Wolbachia endosymbiont of Drosophila innubila]|uniref:hypothetical protein n=1 Tax=Wolbachia endosymbiont of Drosophila innubila TaxID=282263 RepID=UPI001F3AEAB4|nr:hypothetical protein [Wolbachia endosymbiont of Drosophila innubila]
MKRSKSNKSIFERYGAEINGRIGRELNREGYRTKANCIYLLKGHSEENNNKLIYMEKYIMRRV